MVLTEKKRTSREEEGGGGGLIGDSVRQVAECSGQASPIHASTHPACRLVCICICISDCIRISDCICIRCNRWQNTPDNVQAGLFVDLFLYLYLVEHVAECSLHNLFAKFMYLG